MRWGISGAIWTPHGVTAMSVVILELHARIAEATLGLHRSSSYFAQCYFS